MASRSITAWVIVLCLAIVAAQNCYYRKSTRAEDIKRMAAANKLKPMATSAPVPLANRLAMPMEAYAGKCSQTVIKMLATNTRGF